MASGLVCGFSCVVNIYTYLGSRLHHWNCWRYWNSLQCSTRKIICWLNPNPYIWISISSLWINCITYFSLLIKSSYFSYFLYLNYNLYLFQIVFHQYLYFPKFIILPKFDIIYILPNETKWSYRIDVLKISDELCWISNWIISHRRDDKWTRIK